MLRIISALSMILAFSSCKHQNNASSVKELPPSSTCFYGKATLYRTLLQQKTLNSQLLHETCPPTAETPPLPACDGYKSVIIANKRKILDIEDQVAQINLLPEAKRPPCNDPNDLNSPGLTIAGDREFQELVEKSRVYAKEYSPAHDCDDFANDLVAIAANPTCGKAFEIYRFNFWCSTLKKSVTPTTSAASAVVSHAFVGDPKQKARGHAITVAPVQWESGNIEYCAIEPQRDPSKNTILDTCWDTSQGRKPPPDIIADLCLTYFQSDNAVKAELGKEGEPVIDPGDSRLDPTYCAKSPAHNKTRSCYNTCCYGGFRRATATFMRDINRYNDADMNKYLGQCYAACDEVVPLSRQLSEAQRCYVGKSRGECPN